MSDTDFEHVVPALLTLTRVAAVLDCSTRTVRRRIHDGALPAVIEGERTMVRGDDLRAYIESLDGTRRRPGVGTWRRSQRGYDFLA